MEDSASQEFMIVSPWLFAWWWLVFLAMHTVICGYNAAFALFYLTLGGTDLEEYLEFFRIGMVSRYHPAIATVHAAMAALHGFSGLLMLGCSFWYRSLRFTPWGECCVSNESSQLSPSPGCRLHAQSSFLYRSVSKLTGPLTDRYGLLGVNGKHFHAVTTCREIVETVLQTVQGYRMSWFLPSTLLNRFFIVTLALNCWSSAIVYLLPLRNNEAHRRFATLACDCALDLISCMGVTLIVVLSYADDYDTSTAGFDRVNWYNDEWTARVLNEFQMVLVVSWSDLVSRAIFSLGLLFTTTNMKELLYREPRHGNRNRRHASKPVFAKQVKVRVKKIAAADAPVETVPSSSPVLQNRNGRLLPLQLRYRIIRMMERGVHVLFLLWGLLILAIHTQASLQPTLPQCLLQVRPWAVASPSCYLVGLDCYLLNISGERDEVDSLWRDFDGSSVVMMLIRHCPSLDVPDTFTQFHQIHGIKVYNSTIVQWRESAAITNTNHPLLTGVLLIRVNMSDGLLPVGFQSTDFPRYLYDFEMCATNLRELPDDIDTKWNLGSQIFVEYSQLHSVPTALLHLAVGYFSLTGNPIAELPPELFEIEEIIHLAVGDTHIRELPSNVTRLSSTLASISLTNTNISYFWSWMDQLLEPPRAAAYPSQLLAGGSAYCEEWRNVLDGETTFFNVSPSNDYSSLLMNPANAVHGKFSALVDCSSWFGGPLYPLAIEDLNNAIKV